MDEGTNYYYNGYRGLLFTELNFRKGKNPNFSLRSFARVLGISPSHLSHLMSGKKPLTKRQAAKISEKLNLSPSEKVDLLAAMNPEMKIGEVRDKKVLKEDEFRLISDWYHYAILSLGDVKGSKANTKWISKRLGISEGQAQEAFQRLKRMGLIKVIGNTYKQSSLPLDTPLDLPSAALRRFHAQNLDRAKEKMESLPVALRDFSSITIAFNPANLKKAKELIAKFEDKFCSEFEKGEKTEVYTLAVQLFPATVGEDK